MDGLNYSSLKLQFGHDCRNFGCNLEGCGLCRNNPNRRCQTHFREKYVDNANRVFGAWCNAPIMVRVTDAISGEDFVDAALDRPHVLEGIRLQLCLLDGVAYDQKEKERGAAYLTDEDYDEMMILENQTRVNPEPLLVPGRNCPGIHTDDFKLMVDFMQVGDGRVEAPILVRTSRSSQNAQGGRTRPFRMLAKAVYENGTSHPSILPDVSEPFVVTTRRTQGAEKALVPKWNDSVSKLPGVGKETINKLKDLQAVGFTKPLHNYKITTVGELFTLVDQADAALMAELGKSLGVKCDKVEDLQRKARTVAREDHRKRVFGSPDYPAERLLYPCEEGAPDLLCKDLEVMRDTNFGEPAEILQTSELDTDSFQRVTRMRQVALESWWAPRHPGWGIIDEAPPDEDKPAAATPPPDIVQVASLRQQMARQCKQQRFYEPAISDPYQDQSDHGPSRSHSGYRPNRTMEAESQTSNASNEFDSSSVSAPIGAFPGPRSVFEDSFDLDDGLHDNLLDIPHPEPYNTNPNAPDINNAPSLGQLHEVPMGLAYITSAPCFEKNGPIRFKRSVSGNRYKSPAATGNAWSTLGQGNAEGSDGLKPFQPSTGFFAGLPMRPSRELRSQTSLDRVANWQQTRSLASGTLAERLSFTEQFSGGFLQSLLDEVNEIPGNFDEAREIGL